MQQFHELKEELPVIGNIAGRGFHIGVELVTDRKTKERAFELAEKVMYRCMEMGLAFKIIEGNIITLRPSLVLSKDDCDFIIQTIKTAILKELRN